MYKISTDYGRMMSNTVGALVKYIEDNDIKSLVLGVSGGVDSALIACLAHDAVQRTNKRIPVIGRSITIETNKHDEIARARMVGECFCDDFAELDLTDGYKNLYHHFMDTGIVGGDDEKIAQGNVKARIRMIQLYHLAGINKGMVLSTDNFTELMVGFWTLHGDVGDYGMIQNLWKTEVYGLTRYLADFYKKHMVIDKSDALFQCACAVPTDGLGISNSDLDQLGARSYEEVDEILIDFLNNGQHCEGSWEHPVIKRHLATQFKRDNPYNIARKEIV